MTADLEKMCRETVQIAHEEAPELCIGYLKCYSGKEFQQAVAEFTEKYPDVAIHIINGKLLFETNDVKMKIGKL